MPRASEAEKARWRRGGAGRPWGTTRTEAEKVSEVTWRDYKRFIERLYEPGLIAAFGGTERCDVIVAGLARRGGFVWRDLWDEDDRVAWPAWEALGAVARGLQVKASTWAGILAAAGWERRANDDRA